MNHLKNINGNIDVIINDTVGTLLCSSFLYPNKTKIRLIIGTGTNTAYIEPLENNWNNHGHDMHPNNYMYNYNNINIYPNNMNNNYNNNMSMIHSMPRMHSMQRMHSIHNMNSTYNNDMNRMNINNNMNNNMNNIEMNERNNNANENKEVNKQHIFCKIY